jgi:hypothetical protein
MRWPVPMAVLKKLFSKGVDRRSLKPGRAISLKEAPLSFKIQLIGLLLQVLLLLIILQSKFAIFHS